MFVAGGRRCFLNLIEKFRDKTPEEKNKSYLNTILCCSFLVVLLFFTILAISFPETHGAENTAEGTCAQSAAAEISAGLQVESEDSLSSALSYVETNYASTPSDKRSELVQKRFTNVFFSYLKSEAGIASNAAEEVVSGSSDVRRIELTDDSGSSDSSGSSDNEESTLSSFENYLESFVSDDLDVSVSPSSYGLYIAYSKSDNYVEIQNLTIKSGKDGSELVTDIRFTPPSDAADSGSGTYQGAVNSYAAAADGSIISTGGTNHIDGSVYAGESIDAETGGTFVLDGPETVTRGDINVSGSALLDITDGEVWADNVNTESSSGSVVTSNRGDNITAVADFFLKGSLTLGNTGYDVDINGNYYGYGTGDDSLDSSSSSSGSSSSSSSSSSSLTGSTGTALLQKLFNTDRILTSTDGNSTTYSAASSSTSNQSTITITAGSASAHVAYMPGQTLWLAKGSIYSVAGSEGRTAFTSTYLPTSASSLSDDTGASNLDMLYTYQYNGLIGGFDKNSSTSEPTYDLVSHLLSQSGLDEEDTNAIYVPDGQGGYERHDLEVLSSADGGHVSLTPRSDYKSGIVIADCDVNITNINFTGMVITTGDINLTGGATITSSPSISFTSLTDSSSGDNSGENGRVQIKLTENNSSDEK